MRNADKFKEIFGIYATELFAKSDKEFLEWLIADVPDKNVGDLISREAMGDAVNRIRVSKNETWYSFYQKVLKELCKLPSADPNPCEVCIHYDKDDECWRFCPAEPERKTGQWLPSRDRDYNECSCCHRITEPQVVAYKFCPYCGAKMKN